ncbi:TPA: DUF1642 domain-containing protein [Listeria monocytogenes]|nr:DUF1642 domain-containing protein [Listeria innocua]HAM1801978.1 DUF1642 domain-containing protein [Listeria monocytogenes]
MRFKEGENVHVIVGNELLSGWYNGKELGTSNSLVKVSRDKIISTKDCFIAKEKEPELVVVPQFVADWFEANKDNLGLEIWMYIYNFDKHKNECDSFCMFMNDKTGKQLETLISMQYGYYVQKEVIK